MTKIISKEKLNLLWNYFYLYGNSLMRIVAETQEAYFYKLFLDYKKEKINCEELKERVVDATDIFLSFISSTELYDCEAVDVLYKSELFEIDANKYYYYVDVNKIQKKEDLNQIVSQIAVDLSRFNKRNKIIEQNKSENAKYIICVDVQKYVEGKYDKKFVKSYILMNLETIMLYETQREEFVSDINKLLMGASIQIAPMKFLGLFLWDLVNIYGIKLENAINAVLLCSELTKNDLNDVFSLHSEKFVDLILEKINNKIRTFIKAHVKIIDKDKTTLVNEYLLALKCIGYGKVIVNKESRITYQYKRKKNKKIKISEKNINNYFNLFEIRNLFAFLKNEINHELVTDFQKLRDKIANLSQPELNDYFLQLYGYNGHFLSLEILFLNFLLKDHVEKVYSYCSKYQISFKYFESDCTEEELLFLLNQYIDDNDQGAIRFRDFFSSIL